MRFRPIRLLPSALLLAACLSSELNAQTTTSGALAGVATDPSNAVLPDAEVEIQDLAIAEPSEDNKQAIITTLDPKPEVSRVPS